MRRRVLILTVALLTLAVPCGERPVVPCGGDADCWEKNPDYCGGAYEPPCDRRNAQ